MTRSEPHPQRCETCGHYQTRFEYGNKKICTLIKEKAPGSYQIGIPFHIDIVGCASHSASGPVPDSTTLIEMAEREWHSREERRGIHDKVPWTTGWMSGYLSSVGDIQQARKQEREKVLEMLDELRKYANVEYNESDASDNEREMRIHLEYENRVWDIMKSLRQQEGKP
jgi:hypothetical protein